MKYCIIEKWHNDYSLPDDCQAIAISASACYELEKCGFDYININKFSNSKYKSGDLYKKFRKSQLKWFQNFDTLVQNTFPDAKKLNLKLATLYSYNIQYLMEHLIANTFDLKSLFKKNKPTKVYYIKAKASNNKFDKWNWFIDGENTYIQVLKILCESMNIKCEELKFITKKNNSIRFNIFLKIFIVMDLFRMKSLIRSRLPVLLLFLKKISYRYKLYKNKMTNRFSSINNNKSILIIKISDDSIGFIKDISRRGYNIKYYENDGIKDISSFFFSNNFDIKLNKEGYPHLDFEIKKIINDSIISWINNYCGIDLTKILEIKFFYLFNILFPETITLIKGFVKYFNENNIDYVFTNSLAHKYDFSAVAAAKISMNTKSICFFHGLDAFKDDFRFFGEYYHFDYYFTTTKYEAKMIEELKNQYKYSSPKVGTNSYFFDKQRKNKKIRSLNHNNRQAILLLPIIRKKRYDLLIKNHDQTLDVIDWHNRLVSYFNSRKDCIFIWKDFFHYNNLDESIYLKLKNNKYDNIRYESNALENYLPKVDKVICDIPSTGFFKCVISKIPVISFNNINHNLLNQNFFPYIGNCIQSYSNLDDKIQKVDNFINEKPNKYIVDIDRPKNKVIDIL